MPEEAESHLRAASIVRAQEQNGGRAGQLPFPSPWPAPSAVDGRRAQYLVSGVAPVGTTISSRSRRSSRTCSSRTRTRRASVVPPLPALTIFNAKPASFIHGCQYRLMSMNRLPVLTDGLVCCSPLLREPIDRFDLSQPTISHHLRVLREAGLIESERRRTWVYYRARPDVLDQLAGLFTPVEQQIS